MEISRRETAGELLYGRYGDRELRTADVYLLTTSSYDEDMAY